MVSPLQTKFLCVTIMFGIPGPDYFPASWKVIFLCQHLLRIAYEWMLLMLKLYIEGKIGGNWL